MIMEADFKCQLVINGFESGDIPGKDMPTLTLYCTTILEGVLFCDDMGRNVGGRTDLQVITIYRDQILRMIVRPFVGV